MKLLIVSATPFEVAPLVSWLEEGFDKTKNLNFVKNNVEVTILITGVGMALTGVMLGSALAQQTYDFVLNVGVAGAFDKKLKLGEVVNVVSEQFGDLGVEESDGRFTDAHELSLLEPHQPPFLDGKLLNVKGAEFDFLPKVKGLTVNKVHGFQPSIDAIRSKFDAGVESMEGAAFFLACLLAGVPFLEIRAISNYVEPRNRENWELALAIEHLNETLIHLISSLEMEV